MLGTGLFAPIYRRLVTAQQRLVTARELVQGAIQVFLSEFVSINIAAIHSSP